MPKRLRVIQYIVQPVAVLDDGENLVPAQPRSLTVPVDKWGEFVDHGLKDALAQLQKELNSESDQAGAGGLPSPTAPLAQDSTRVA